LLANVFRVGRRRSPRGSTPGLPGRSRRLTSIQGFPPRSVPSTTAAGRTREPLSEESRSELRAPAAVSDTAEDQQQQEHDHENPEPGHANPSRSPLVTHL
jgi:hypothetical protein